MPKNMLFYDNICERITDILIAKYGDISKNGNVNYCTKKYFCYDILVSKMKNNDRVKEIIEGMLNNYNDNSMKYSKEVDGFTHNISNDVIDKISLMFAVFYKDEYLKLRQVASSIGINRSFKSRIKSHKELLNAKEYEYVVTLYKEICEVYDEEDEEYILLSLSALLGTWNFTINKLPKRLSAKTKGIRAAKIAIYQLRPFFERVYKEMLRSEVILSYLDIILKAKYPDDKNITQMDFIN